MSRGPSLAAEKLWRARRPQQGGGAVCAGSRRGAPMGRGGPSGRPGRSACATSFQAIPAWFLGKALLPAPPIAREVAAWGADAVARRGGGVGHVKAVLPARPMAREVAAWGADAVARRGRGVGHVKAVLPARPMAREAAA